MTERDLFLAALEIDDPAAQAAFLERASGSDPGLADRVRALLGAHEQSGPFMERPAAGATLTGPARTSSSRSSARAGSASSTWPSRSGRSPAGWP
jgi:hypothetical protein